MLNLRNTHNLQRTLTSLSLIAAPLAGLAGDVLTPQFTDGLTGELSSMARQPEQWLISDFLILLSFALLIPAVFGLLHLLRDPWVIPGHLGAALVGLGAYFHAAVIGYSLVELSLVQSEHTPTQQLAFAGQMYEHTAFSMLLIPFLGFYLGLVLLMVALWRAWVAPLWVTLVIIAALLSEFFGPEALSPTLMFVLLLIGFGWLGLKIGKMPNTEWAKASLETLEMDKLVGRPAPLLK